jgi:hypothetical protein
MAASRSDKVRVLLLFGATAVSALPSAAGPFSLVSASEQVTAVSSKVFNGYARNRLPDGSFQPETYAFGDGGLVVGTPLGADTAAVGADQGRSAGARSDETIDGLPFSRIAKTVAGSLASQNYVATPSADSTRLLIMVYWGATIGSLDTLEGPAKDMADARNAALLGFDSEPVFAQGFGDPSNMMANILRQLHSDVVDALEVDRYFVILRAFDFRLAWKEKRIKLLWETRFSLSERQHDFAKELPGMAQYASTYFGQDSHGLLRSPIPEGRVEIGEVKSLGAVPEK